MTKLSAFDDIGVQWSVFIRIGLGETTCLNFDLFIIAPSSSSSGTGYPHSQRFMIPMVHRQTVQYIHDTLAQDGDTIALPVGTFTWTTGVRITKGITIQGQTVVGGDHTTWSVGSPPQVSDQTILVDNITSGARFFDGSPMLAGKNFRITGITFKGGTGSGSNGPIAVGCGTSLTASCSHNVRFDHLHFTGQLHRARGVEVYNGIRGVQDHVVADQVDRSNPQNFQNKVENGSYPYGDLEWSQPSGFGTDDFWFVEDCWLNNDTGAVFSAAQGFDGDTGTKLVIRYSFLFNTEILCHGMEGTRTRGGRAMEIYNNEYHWDYSTQMDGVRSGTLIVHDNTLVGNEPTGWNQQTYRMIYGYGGSGAFAGWKGATGASAWDLNDPGGLFDSGTVTSSVNGGNGTMTDQSKAWTPNQWAGFQVSNPANGNNFLILSNTSNTLSTRQWGDPCCIQNFAPGNTYQIRRVLQCLDQPGAGASDLISGDNPPPTWLHQGREGNYSWNNIHTATGHHVNFTSSTPNLIAGRDYFQDTPMPGYTPYTYPHPLVSDPPLPSPTPSATVTPSPTPTPTPTPSPTPAPSPTPTATPAPTATPMPSPTSPTPSPRPPPSPTPTSTPAATPTSTPTPTATATATSTNADSYIDSYCNADRNRHSRKCNGLQRHGAKAIRRRRQTATAVVNADSYGNADRNRHAEAFA